MPGPLDGPRGLGGPDGAAGFDQSAQQLEAILLRQLLQSSGAFRAGSTPGAQLRNDMFVETLADAVAKAGGLGVARLLQKQLDPNGKAAATAGQGGAGAGGAGALAAAFPRAGLLSWPAASGQEVRIPGARATAETGGIGALDDLDDPNSDAPLAEDPTAPTLDDFQPENAALIDAHILRAEARAAHLTPQRATTNMRALNRYRERVEDPHAGTPSGARLGDEP